MIEINKIYNEDCLIGMQNIPDKSIERNCIRFYHGFRNNSGSLY